MDARTQLENFDKREARTRTALQNALVVLLGEKDYDTLTVQQICDRANVARKTFYEHYDSKDSLLWDYCEGIYESLQRHLTRLDVDTLLSDGKPLTYPVFVHVMENAIFYGAMLGQQIPSVFVVRLLDYMAQASYERHEPLRAASERITIPPDLIAHYLAGALVGAIRWWLKTGLKATPETMAYQFSQLAVPGVLDALGLS